jgi:flagellar biosynthesis/type III secretory pathway protein FliH
MGYSSEQLFTVPFLVYMKALQKLTDEPEKEINQKIFSLIEETCIKVVGHSPTFREDVAKKV